LYSGTLAEVTNDSNTVIGNAGDLKPLLSELFERLVQLYQLILAIGSPVGGTIKTNDQAARTLEGVEITPVAVLVTSANGRNCLPHLDPNFLRHIGTVKVSLTQHGFK
jgi:hypothetical protein